MRQIKFAILTLMLLIASPSAVQSNEICKCEKEALKSIEQMSNASYNEILKALILDHRATYKIQLSLVEFLLKVDKCPDKLRASAQNAKGKLTAGQIYLTKLAEKSAGKEMSQALFIASATELRKYTDQTRNALTPVLYGDGKRPSRPDAPIVINPDFSWVNCDGGSTAGSPGGGNSVSECESKGNDMANSCVTASSIKSQCGYYNQFGSQEAAQSQANSDMQNCIDKSTSFKIICNMSRLACPGADLSGFGSAGAREIVDDAMEDCRRAGTAGAGKSPGQKQTETGK